MEAGCESLVLAESSLYQAAGCRRSRESGATREWNGEARMKPKKWTATALFAAALMTMQASGQTTARPERSFDVVIRHGHIIDGTGSPWYSGDVGIRDGRIAAIGELSGVAAKRDDRCAGKSGCARIHRHAGAVGTDDAGRSARAVEDLSGDHDRDYRRGQFGRTDR